MSPWRHRTRVATAVLAAALGQAPIDAAYGLIALASLGIGNAAMALALLGSVLANIVACLRGEGRLVGGPRPVTALLTAGLVATLASLPQLQRADGSVNPATIVLLASVGLVAAAGLQMLFGALRAGSLVKFTPHPVRQGLTTGVALLLILTGVPVMLGSAFGVGWSGLVDLRSLPAASWLVALVAMIAMLQAQRMSPRAPAVPIGLLCAALVQALLAQFLPPTAFGPALGVPQLPWDAFANWPTVLHDATSFASSASLRSAVQLAWILAAFALATAVLLTLDTLLSASVVDGRFGLSRNGNRELRAQAWSNMAAALVGGQASAPALARSLMLVAPIPAVRHAVSLYGAALLGLLLLAPALFAALPLCAVGSVIVVQGWKLLDKSLWRTPLDHLLRRGAHGEFDDTQQRLSFEHWVVLSTVVAVSLVWGLSPAVLFGAVLSMLLFVRANARDILRRSTSGDRRHSLKVRTPLVQATLRAQGSRIAILELQGALFFGTADQLRGHLRPLLPHAQTVILDLRHLHEIDGTGARILLEAADDLARGGALLMVSEWAAGDRRRRVVDALMASDGGSLSFADYTDEALERAEDRLLASLPGATLAPPEGHALSLAETLLGQGLDEHELALLAAETTCVEVPLGEALFRAGDPGDAIYVSLQGEIGIYLAGHRRRLASFAPGVMVGEMAVLEKQLRSADAIAETRVVALRLSGEAFERLRMRQPALAAKLMHNISLYLSGRLRGLTTELADWLGR